MPAPAKSAENCLFCKIVRGEVSAHRVFEDDETFVFLDHRPLFPGHCLLVTKNHFEALGDLQAALLTRVFFNVQLIAGAVEAGMKAEGTFVAVNNRVSQSVPHFHVHIVPRRKGDGLKGFFWPRSKYKSDEQAAEVLRALQAAIAEIREQNASRA